MSAYDEIRTLSSLVDALRRQLAEAESERDRYREHSILLNSVGDRLSVALGREVGADDAEVVRKVDVDVDDLIRGR